MLESFRFPTQAKVNRERPSSTGIRILRERSRPLLTLIIGTLVVLHGLVHLLYSGQSCRLFELQPGMVWPQNAWTISRLLGNRALRSLATVACALAAIGFVAGATGLFSGHDWWRPMVVGSAAFSTVLFALFWDGRTEHLSENGAVGVLIDLVLIAVVVVPWQQVTNGPG
jgi:hypothetical protein